MWALPITWAAPVIEGEPIEVVVTATRSTSRDHPVGVEVIDREAIEATGAETVAEVLQEQPGVQIDRTVTGTAIRLQGMNPEHTLILIDGQRVLGRKDGVIDLSRIQLANIERIEIVKGPSSSVFGSDAMGGVVNLITRKPAGAEIGAHVRFGTQTRVDLDGDVSLPIGNTAHRFAVGWHSQDAWDRHPDTPSTDASAIEQKNAAYTLSMKPSSNAGLSLDVAYQQRDLTGIDSNTAGAVLDRLQVIEDARVALSAWGTPSDDARVSGSLSAALYKDQFINDQRGGKALDIASITEEANAEANVVLDQRWLEHTFTLGIDGLMQHLASDRLKDRTALRSRGGAFAQATISYRTRGGPHLRWSPGVRADVDTQFGTAVSPRIAGSATWSRVVVRAGAGLGFRAPDFRELYLVFENPGVGYVVTGSEDLRAEHSTNVNAAVEWTVGDDFSVDAAGYSNWIRDLIDIGDADLEPGALQRFGYANIARAWTAGGEFGFQATPGPVDLRLNAALTHTRDLDQAQPLAARVPIRVTGALGVDLTSALAMRAQAGVSGPRVAYVSTTEGPDRRQDEPSMVTADLRGRWKSGDGWEVFVGLDNVLGTTGTPLAPLAPRFLYIGFNLRDAVEL